MTAYALSLIQCDGNEDLLDEVQVVQADTLSLVQGATTSASTTSESSCAAVRVCCDILAHSENANLSASTYLVPDSDSMRYLNYGAAVSEVEVNILTGETIILRSDIIYDCGQSLNPAVDLGHVP
ncbi:hypothetical protein LguiB_031796 [Lonicera macranthoides]